VTVKCSGAGLFLFTINLKCPRIDFLFSGWDCLTGPAICPAVLDGPGGWLLRGRLRLKVSLNLNKIRARMELEKNRNNVPVPIWLNQE